MGSSPLLFTPIEQVAFDAILEDRPETRALLAERLARVLDDLAQTCQGLVATDARVDELLARLRHQFVGHMMLDLNPWGDDEDLREPVIDLLTRHLLDEARDGFGRRVVGGKKN